MMGRKQKAAKPDRELMGEEESSLIYKYPLATVFW